MDHITIPIPDGLDDRQKSDLVGWLTDLARQTVSAQSPFEADPAFRAEATKRIKQGMADVAAGGVCDSKEAMRRIAEKHGLAPPA